MYRNMLHLAARTHNRAAVCLHAAQMTALRKFWTDWPGHPRQHSSDPKRLGSPGADWRAEWELPYDRPSIYLSYV